MPQLAKIVACGRPGDRLLQFAETYWMQGDLAMAEILIDAAASSGQLNAERLVWQAVAQVTTGKLNQFWSTLAEAQALLPNDERLTSIVALVHDLTRTYILDSKECLMQILSAEEFLNRLSERGSRAELCQLKEGHNSRPLHINFIANAFVVGSEGTIIDDETSTIFSNSFSSMKQSQVTASKISPRITASLDEALYIPGYVAHLCGRWSGNFFHWMSEILPRAFLLHNAGFGGLYMVPACQHPFIIDSLRMLGIPYERIISNDAEGPIQCEYLAAFDSFWFADHYENPWMMLNLRDFLLQKVDTTSPLPSTAQGLHIIMRNGSRSVPQ